MPEPTPSPNSGERFNKQEYLDARDGLEKVGVPPLFPDYAFLPNAKILLTFPIERDDGSQLKEITIRRPKVKDNVTINALSNGKTEDEKGIIMLRHLTGLTPNEFDELDLADVNRLGEWLQVFTSARKKK